MRQEEEGDADDQEREKTQGWQSVILEDQVQKHFEKGEVMGLQDDTEISKMQWTKSNHYAQHQVTGESCGSCLERTREELETRVWV